MSAWGTAPLGELADSLDSRRVPVSAAERATRPGVVPYYGAAGQVGTIDRALFDEPLLLLGEDGVGYFDPIKPKAYLIDGPSWVNNHAHVLRAGPRIERRFLLYYLNQFNYLGYANGTTRLKLTKAAMNSIPVPVPAIDEQRRIVDALEEHLSRLDVASLHLADADKRAYALSMSSSRVLVEEALAKSPVSTVGAEADLVQYGTSAKSGPLSSSSDVSVLRMGNIKNGAVEWSCLKFLPRDHRDFPSLILKPGDLLFNRTNSAEHVGKSAVFGGETEASFASYLIRVRFGSSVLPAWANLVINSPFGRSYVGSVVSQQVGQANVNGTKLKAFPLPLPPIRDQASKVASHEEAIAKVRRTTAVVARAEQRQSALRRSLLEAAFSGSLTGSNT